MPTIESTRFGPFDIADDAALTFPTGMVGFPCSRRYALVTERPGDPFFWLHSLDEPELAFPVTDPWAFHPGYELELGDEDLALLEVGERKDVAVFAVVSVGSDPTQATINLLAPVAINLRRRLGAQVLNRIDSSARAPLFAGDVGAPRPPAETPALTVLPAR